MGTYADKFDSYAKARARDSDMRRSVRLILVIMLFFCSRQKLSHATDTINATQSLEDKETLVSSGGIFELGFFSPGKSNNWYLGVWYKNTPNKTVVWVANREIPLNKRSSGALRVIPPGHLVLLNNGNSTVWSSNSSGIASNPVVQLLDSGNLVVRDASDDRVENYLWQSFDYPTDTLLPGMTLGLNSVYLTAWKSSEDPAPGDFTIHLDQAGYPQLFIEKRGVDQVRVGPWNGLYFSGTAYASTPNPAFLFLLHKNKEGVFYAREDAVDKSVLFRSTLNPNGVSQRWKWVDLTRAWVLQMSIPLDNCDTYNTCGAHGKCTVGSFTLCECLDKFEPKDPKGWAAGDWSSNGCVRRTPLDCKAGDGFVKYSNLKLPDARNSWYNESMTLDECKVECLSNCSCMAYRTLNVSKTGTGTGCLLWFGNLTDIRILPVGGQDLYIRMASSELGSNGFKKQLIVSLTTAGTALLLLTMLLCIWKRKKNQSEKHAETQDKELELPLFDLSTISKATNKFSIRNKLGEGGFGPVYKGTLGDGQDIAVKRLSETSKQGLDEFKNEVIFVAKLQHRNLVKLLGCCIQGAEKMLIYEYMPNKSLDTIIFDQTNSTFLDWPKRFNIVNGIARGLMYLHQDSRLRIIHRDLKASNILLDSEMNPKISDFGIAKSYQESVTEDKTNRVVGTYGYMSPEYAICGRFSEKSDVFSFGVIVLEIVSGKRNTSYSCGGHQYPNLQAHAWTLHLEGRPIQIIDSYLGGMDNLEEVQRIIHVGLLCLQEDPRERPSMTVVVAMLSNDYELPQPNQPGFFMEAQTSSNVSPLVSSTNEMEITALVGR